MDNITYDNFLSLKNDINEYDQKNNRKIKTGC